MKQAKTLLTLLCLSVSICNYAQTKNNTQFNVGINVGATPSFNRSIVGADLRLEQPINTRGTISLMLTSGYTGFNQGITYGYFTQQAKTEITYSSFGLVPVKAGIKMFPFPHFYFAAEAGIAFGVAGTVTSYQSIDNSGTITNNGTAPSLPSSFGYSPAVGINAGKKWDLSVRYENFTKYPDEFALRVAYRL